MPEVRLADLFWQARERAAARAGIGQINSQADVDHLAQALASEIRVMAGEGTFAAFGVGHAHQLAAMTVVGDWTGARGDPLPTMRLNVELRGTPLAVHLDDFVPGPGPTFCEEHNAARPCERCIEGWMQCPK